MNTQSTLALATVRSAKRTALLSTAVIVATLLVAIATSYKARSAVVEAADFGAPNPISVTVDHGSTPQVRI